MARPASVITSVGQDEYDYDDIEAAYEPLSPTSSCHSGDLALANWGSIAFEDLLYTDEGLQDIVKSFRAAVIQAIKQKEFDEAHTKAEEQAKFLRDYIRRCMGAEHVCSDSEDYEQAQKIAKAIKFATHLKKVTGERGGLAFGAVRRIIELLDKYKRHIENTRLEMKEAGEQRNYTKAIALQHDLESCKNDYALKLCAHVDRILESGNLRALEVACKTIQDHHPDLQPDIMHVDPAESGEAALIAAPPGTARRPHSARSAREEPPERHRFDGTKKIKSQEMDEMAKRLAVPKKSMEEKATTETELQKGIFMLQEEYDNCTFRPTIGVKGVIKPSIMKNHGTFWPTDRYPRRAPSPHGKARFEGDINLDPEGTWQLRRCIRFVTDKMSPHVLQESAKPIDKICGLADVDGCLHLISLALQDDTQVVEWKLTEKELVVLNGLHGSHKLFQLTDDLRSKDFLTRADAEVKKVRSQFLNMQEAMKDYHEQQETRIQKVSVIKEQSYNNLVQGRDTPGRQKRREKMNQMLNPATPRMDIKACAAIIAQTCQLPVDDTVYDNLVALISNEEEAKRVLKCDLKEVKKLKQQTGNALMRYAAGLCKRAKFVARMDSYNYKTKTV